MALIWRGIFDVSGESSEEDVVAWVEDWLRWKLRDNGIDLPLDGGQIEHESGCEITGRCAEDRDLWGLRAALFERVGDEQIRTTITSARSEGRAWVWVDLERWSAEAFARPWVPIAPGVVRTILSQAKCYRGATLLPHEPELVVGDDGGARLAQRLLDSRRDVPFVVVAPTREELADDTEPAMARATEISRRLIGIAPVMVLGAGAVEALSRETHAALGEGFDVFGGAVRTYLPGITDDDAPQRHRFVPFRRIAGRAPNFTAEIVAASIQRGACAQVPPRLWRDRLRALVEPDGVPDDDMEAEMVRLEEEREQERSLRARAEDTLEVEREMAAGTEQENSDLRRRVGWLERRLRELGEAAEVAPEDDGGLVLEYCGDVPNEVVSRLEGLAYPESQWEHADALDAHVSAAWAKRAWRAMSAMDVYVKAKRDGSFSGNFRDYCSAGLEGSVPVHWVSLNESETTNSNYHFRQLRTFPVDGAVCGDDRIYMASHVKVVAGGYPAPRIHFLDDTGGPTGMIHVGYFGVHLDNKSTS